METESYYEELFGSVMGYEPIPLEERTKILIYKEGDFWFFSHYSKNDPIRKEALFFNPEIPSEYDEWASDGRSLLAIKGDEGNWSYEKPNSNVIRIKKIGDCVVFDDQKLGVENEGLVDPIEDILTSLFGQMNLREDTRLKSYIKLEEVSDTKDYNGKLLRFIDHAPLFEDGVLYEETKTGREIWLCSCFRHYFDFTNPPEYIGFDFFQSYQ